MLLGGCCVAVCRKIYKFRTETHIDITESEYATSKLPFLPDTIIKKQQQLRNTNGIWSICAFVALKAPTPHKTMGMEQKQNGTRC